VVTVIDNTVARTAGTPKSVGAAVRAKGSDDKFRFYKPRTPIYPKLVHGKWRQIKWAMLILTLTIYWVTPWIRWPRPHGAPQHAVLVDFFGPRFYFFFIELWPQEVYFITGLLVLAALALFMTTALFGRLWCGYSCPQTVWTDLFIVVERMFEGDRNQRMRLDTAPWSFDKAWRKTGKHLTWLGISFATGGAWIFYFQDAPTLIRTFWQGTAPVTTYFSCALLTATTYTFAGMMREQVCTYLCPWPRIQGAMIDDHTLQVIYLRERGEPRGPHKKNESWAGRGDCVDCNQCVIVCPMGIDIRDGCQIECINCGLCVDACDEIMDRVGRPRGLIGYDTDFAVAMRAAGRKPKYQFVRSRTVFYGVALSLVSVIMIWGLATRSPVVFDVLADRNPTFVRLHDGAVRDGYTLKIDNRSFERRDFVVSLSGLPAHTIESPGIGTVSGSFHVVAAPNQTMAVRVFVTVPESGLTNSNLPVTFTIDSGKIHTAKHAVFLSGQANKL
jgi:cytochrome c oxidase accessory protein FixG